MAAEPFEDEAGLSPNRGFCLIVVSRSKLVVSRVQAAKLRVSITLCLASMLLAFCTLACAESIFDLAPSSRLPKWFALPDGMSRDDVRVTMTYYVMPSQRTATFEMFKKHDGRLSKVTGTLSGSEPLTLVPHVMGEPTPYPAYEVITVNGVVDIVEHRQMEPGDPALFYMTDDPNIWARFGDRR
jgi:hypothetical protein